MSETQTASKDVENNTFFLSSLFLELLNCPVVVSAVFSFKVCSFLVTKIPLLSFVLFLCSAQAVSLATRVAWGPC